ncbi:MAG TPA: hypothetical protein VM008_02910 [Phycisphaerae bacterium]|nr:hypothetical protein [Phycisphaerae bacterium]
MSSPLRKTWQDCKKQMGPNSDKQFKEDLGPTLDKAQDAFDAVVAENKRKIKVEGYSDSTADLAKLRSKTATALPLHEKVHKVATTYKSTVDKMDKKAPGVANALKCLNDILTHFQNQENLLVQHCPSEKDAERFKQAYATATLKKMNPGI